MKISSLAVVALDPPPLVAGAPGVTVWRDAAGRDVVFGLTTDDWHWVRVAGVGCYRFALTSSDLHVSAEGMPAPGASTELLVDSYYRTVVPMALHAYGLETLHGSAVVLPAGAIALCAPPRSGKSTIAFALGQRGHGVVADDAVVLDFAAGSGPPDVVPLPFELRLRRPSAEHFESPSKRDVRVGEKSTVADARAPLAAVVVLGRGAEAVKAERLKPEAAFKALLDQSQVFSVNAPDRKGAMMRSYLALASSVPVYRLQYPTGLEVLDEVCDEIELIAGSQAAGQASGVTVAGLT